MTIRGAMRSIGRVVAFCACMVALDLYARIAMWRRR